MKLGVSASRAGLSTRQAAWLRRRIAAADEIHHGACVGGDETAHRIARELGIRIVVHPPVNERLMMVFDEWDFENCLWFPAADYHTRDRDIVDNTDLLAALPNSGRRPHSGTWYTAEYAENRNSPLLVCYPSGLVEGLGDTALTPTSDIGAPE